MGTFGDYSGEMCISEDKKEEFTENILKLLNYGGMMQFDKVCIYGQEIVLVKPVEMDQNGEAHFHFNYFEDDAWESAGYEAGNTRFFSGKIGGREFCDVVTAVHFLYELYDEETGAAMIDGEIVEGSAYIGWINHILGTDFSMKKRFRLWDHFEQYCLERLKYHESGNTDEGYDMRDVVPASLYWALGGCEFADICYIRNGTETLCKEELVAGSYPEAVYKCKEALEQYFDSSTDDETERIRNIWELVKSDRKIRENILGNVQEQGIHAIAEMSLKLPARMLVYLACEINERDFWITWKELYKEAYKDEIMSQYASDELIAERMTAIESSVERVATSEFLCDDGPFTFWGNPKELKGKPNYYISDDDRAFWWDGSEEVVLSEEMEGWLADLSKQHKQLTEEVASENWDRESLLRKMIAVLAEIDAYYKRVFSFQNMFYEFLQNGTDRRYIAAVRLLEKLAEENKAAGKIIERVTGWDITSKNVTHNAGRMAMKRYLSVMANRKLREQYFEF